MLSQVKALLHQFDLKAKKRFGQHFLIDEGVLECILSAAELTSEDIVVEVGPGLGLLTERLAKQAAKVIAVELDSKLVNALRKRLASFPNIKIIPGDILKVAPWQLLDDDLGVIESKCHCEERGDEAIPKDEVASLRSQQGYKVVANLPYYITSPVLHHFLEASCKPSLMVVMVQKEVGEAIAATGGKMSLLSIRTQFYSKPTIITYVLAGSFYPPPKVDSVVLRLDVYSTLPIEISDINGFFTIVTIGFSSPRKQLRNSLAQGLAISSNQVTLLLEGAGIEAKRRAETLSLEEWRKLWEVFAPLRK